MEKNLILVFQVKRKEPMFRGCEFVDHGRHKRDHDGVEAIDPIASTHGLYHTHISILVPLDYGPIMLPVCHYDYVEIQKVMDSSISYRISQFFF
jgi:hypothetical protein